MTTANDYIDEAKDRKPARKTQPNVDTRPRLPRRGRPPRSSKVRGILADKAGALAALREKAALFKKLAEQAAGADWDELNETGSDHSEPMPAETHYRIRASDFEFFIRILQNLP